MEVGEHHLKRVVEHFAPQMSVVDHRVEQVLLQETVNREAWREKRLGCYNHDWGNNAQGISTFYEVTTNSGSPTKTEPEVFYQKQLH